MSRFRRAPSFVVAVLCATVLGAALVACGDVGPAGPPSPTPTGTPLDRVALKLLVIDHIGRDFPYCDPDLYPVGHGTELGNAKEAQARMEADPAYPFILDFLAIDRDAVLTDEQLVRVYDLYKRLSFVDLTRNDEGYAWEARLQNESLLGTVFPDGEEIQVTGRSTNSAGCPICLARDTRIAVPGGFVRVQDIRVGMAVWSTNSAGRRFRAVVLRVGRVPVPATHRVVRLVLADGRTVLVSPGHPTPDGRTVGELRTGRSFEGTRIVTARLVPYSGGFTFDLLPSGPTGTYFANGVLLGSTLGARWTVRPMAAA